MSNTLKASSMSSLCSSSALFFCIKATNSWRTNVQKKKLRSTHSPVSPRSPQSPSRPRPSHWSSRWAPARWGSGPWTSAPPPAPRRWCSHRHPHQTGWKLSLMGNMQFLIFIKFSRKITSIPLSPPLPTRSFRLLTWSLSTMKFKRIEQKEVKGWGIKNPLPLPRKRPKV